MKKSKTKICSTCKEEKGLGEFSKRSTSKDGYRGYCRECHRKYCMKRRRKQGMRPQKVFTEKEVIKAAKKYKHRSDFMKGNSGEYTWAWRNKCLDEVCAHMTPKGTGKDNHIIYVYEFSDGYAYVGQTRSSIENRDYYHSIKGPVFKHLKKCKNYNLRILEYPVIEIRVPEREYYWKNYYLRKTWKPLWSSAKDRSLGQCHTVRKIKSLKTGKIYKTAMDAAQDIGEISSIGKILNGNVIAICKCKRTSHIKGEVFIYLDEDFNIIKKKAKIARTAE